MNEYYCSLYDYLESQKIAAQGYTFYGLLGALVRKADTENLERIRKAFPGFVEMFVERYNAPGGKLDTD